MKQTLTSWKAAQAQIASIVEQINADSRLALAAIMNPLHALEELGYEVDPSVT